MLDPEIRAYGKRMLALLEALFKARDGFNAAPGPETLDNLRRRAAEFNVGAAHAPPKGKPAAIAKRFNGGPHSTYTEFVGSPGVAATNNAAERAIRPIVMIRNVTQGTRGEKGRRASEIFWTVKGTLDLQKRSFSEFFAASRAAMLRGEPGPSILPKG
jgi:hypothetical protein